jgi:serine/threonine/tyrosine-interacting protein
MKSLSLRLSVKIPPVSKVSECPTHVETTKAKNECSHILNDIYLSGYQYSHDYEYLKKNGFTHIINCAAGSKRFKSYFYDDIKYLVLDIQDDPGVELEDAIKKVIDFIEKATAETRNRKILIHCSEGISRGPTLLTSYMMWKYNMDKESALYMVKEKRACVDINFGFMCQLDKLKEKFLVTF